jgi:hypothetical protein
MERLTEGHVSVHGLLEVSKTMAVGTSSKLRTVAHQLVKVRCALELVVFHSQLAFKWKSEVLLQKMLCLRLPPRLQCVMIQKPLLIQRRARRM